MELITEPALLILDEPTSGLDATSTLELLRILRSLADQGKTVILTIHQPRREAFRLIDNIILLAKGGRLAYFGPASKDTLEYFKEVSEVEYHDNVNPADYLMDILDPTSFNKKEVDWERCFLESKTYQKFVVQRLGEPTDKKANVLQVPKRPFWSEFSNLLGRYRKRKLRDRSSLIIQLLQAPVIGGILGLLFLGEGVRLAELEIPAEVEKIPAIVSAMQLQNGMHPTLFLIGAAAFWLGCSNVAREIVSDFPIFLRERRSGLRIPSYLASIFTYQLLLASLQTFIIALCIWGLTSHSAWFLIQWLILVLISACGISTGLFLSSVAYTEVTAISLVPLILLPQLMLGGYIKLYRLMTKSVWESRIADLTPIRWAFESLAIVEYDFASRQNTHLRKLSDVLGFENTDVAHPLLMLSAFILFNVVLTVFILRYRAD
ncbi:MAG: ABC transporter permease [Myxococcota bacterium]|nr:ABC transporter permease [Myxococcota bacterium]